MRTHVDQSSSGRRRDNMAGVSFKGAGATLVLVLLAVAVISAAPLELRLSISDAHGLEKIQLDFYEREVAIVDGNPSHIPGTPSTFDGDKSHPVLSPDFGNNGIPGGPFPSYHGDGASRYNSHYFTSMRNDIQRPYNPQQINPHGVQNPSYHNAGDFTSPGNSDCFNSQGSAQAENPVNGQRCYPPGGKPALVGKPASGVAAPGAARPPAVSGVGGSGGFGESGFFVGGRRVRRQKTKSPIQPAEV